MERFPNTIEIDGVVYDRRVSVQQTPESSETAVAIAKRVAGPFVGTINKERLAAKRKYMEEMLAAGVEPLTAERHFCAQFPPADAEFVPGDDGFPFTEEYRRSVAERNGNGGSIADEFNLLQKLLGPRGPILDYHRFTRMIRTFQRKANGTND